MSQFNDPNMGMPPKKKSSAMTWIIILIVVLLGVPLLCCGGCIGMGMWGIGQAGKQMAEQLKDAPAVQEHLGDGLTMSMNLTATGEEAQKNPPPPGQQGAVVFDAKGSKGSGKIIMKQSPGGGIESAILRTSDGKEYPLK